MKSLSDLEIKMNAGISQILKVVINKNTEESLKKFMNETHIQIH